MIMTIFRGLLMILVGFLSATAFAKQTADFDFYVLSLSWSPDYCESSGQHDKNQCSIGKKLGFVLHGAWPQYEKPRSGKSYPANCSAQKLPKTSQEACRIYPSPKLCQHEWEKHGTCSGLKPEAYLALSKNMKELINIPQNYQRPEKPFRTTSVKLKNDFVKANPQFSSEGMGVYCSGGRFLKELRLCLTKESKPRQCGQQILQSAQKSCSQKDFLVRNVK